MISSTHRPWPVPKKPWVMKQVWHDLLFMHWPINPELLRKIVPSCLDLDTFNGQAWIGVVPFRMSGVRLRGTPALPGLSAFPELNVRTYVILNGKPGVYFFSLDAASILAVATARRWFHLPYYWARMTLQKKADTIHYWSERRAKEGSAKLVCRYRPTGPAAEAKTATLEYWLTERYCLYAVDSTGEIYRGEILHLPWPLQPAEVTIESNTMTDPIGLSLPSVAPVIHFSELQEVLIWSPEKIKTKLGIVE